jgi:D-alanyl-D-alanine carboxypeptidase
MVISAATRRATVVTCTRETILRTGRLALAAALILCIAAAPADARKRRARSSYSPPQAAMVLDAHTGRTLYSSNIDEPRYPASITKVMTLYLAFEQIKLGRIKPDTPLKVSAFAAGQAPSKLELKAGSTITLREAMYALVTKSANDAAVVIAENIAGSEAEFARLMTRKAHALGMMNTTYRNASGLPNSEQRTTARDLIILGHRILRDFPEYAPIFKTKVFSYDGETHRNHNGLLFTYSGTEGLKTGFTQASGFNLLASVRRNDKHLLAVVLGGPSARARNARMRKLLNAAWSKAATLASLKARGTPLPARVAVKSAGPLASALKTANASAEASERSGTVLQSGPVAQPMTIAGDDLPERNPAFHPDAAERTLAAALASVEEQRQAANAAQPEPQKAQFAGATMAAATDSGATGPASKNEQAVAEQGDSAPAGVDPANALGPYHVQVGSYLSIGGAKERLQVIAAKAGTVVHGHGELTVTGLVKGKSYYRARFGRFSKSEARSACVKLKALSINCLVVRAE